MDTAESVRKFVEQAQASKSLSMLESVLKSSVRQLGFRSFSYYLVEHPKRLRLAHLSPVFVSSYPSDWTERYVRENYHRIDPILVSVSSRRLPMRWGSHRTFRSLNARQKHVLDEARKFGICRGLAVPVHGPSGELGVFVVASNADSDVVNNAIHENGYALHLVGTYAHAVVVEHMSRENLLPEIDITSEEIDLTIREREVLYWTARGKSSWEISQIIRRSHATVNYHIKQAIRKLNASNKCHAAVKATTLQLIDPSINSVGAELQ